MWLGIVFTFAGISKVSRLLHPLNAPEPIDEQRLPSSKVTLLSDVQPANTLEDNSVTEAGILYF